MYLTAHHVRAPDGSVGINAYLHRHSQSDETRINWERPDVARIANELPGKDVAQAIEVKPGGNTVLGYLDVVAPERADPAFLADSLRLFEHYVREAHFPVVFSSNRIAIRFGIVIGLQRLAFAEFRRLRARVLQLLGDTTESKVRQLVGGVSDPVKVIVARDESGEVYQLSPESVRRVAAVRPEFGPAVRMRVSDDTKSDFESLMGDFYPHIVTSLTGLSREQLGQLGGVEVIRDNQRLWQMPPAGDIPGQVLGIWIRGDESLPRPEHVPTGAILPRQGTKPGDLQILALDLVQVQGLWLPLSEAGVYTYMHSKGLLGGESWAFVTRSSDSSASIVFDATLSAEKLSPVDVEANYGPQAAERARPDYRTMQLQLRRRG